jgi:hypothetical protein
VISGSRSEALSVATIQGSEGMNGVPDELLSMSAIESSAGSNVEKECSDDFSSDDDDGGSVSSRSDDEDATSSKAALTLSVSDMAGSDCMPSATPNVGANKCAHTPLMRLITGSCFLLIGFLHDSAGPEVCYDMLTEQSGSHS